MKMSRKNNRESRRPGGDPNKFLNALKKKVE